MFWVEALEHTCPGHLHSPLQRTARVVQRRQARPATPAVNLRVGVWNILRFWDIIEWLNVDITVLPQTRRLGMGRSVLEVQPISGEARTTAPVSEGKLQPFLADTDS